MGHRQDQLPADSDGVCVQDFALRSPSFAKICFRIPYRFFTNSVSCLHSVTFRTVGSLGW